jgi:hypothetical protein
VEGPESYGEFDYVDVPVLPDEDIFISDFTEEDGIEANTDSAILFKREWAKAQEMRQESPVERVRRIGQTFDHSETQIALVLRELPEEA